MALGYLRPKRACRLVNHPRLFVTTVAKKCFVEHMFVCSKNNPLKNAFYLLMNINFAKEREGFRSLTLSSLSSWRSRSREKHEAMQEMTDTAALEPAMTHETHRADAQHRE